MRSKRGIVIAIPMIMRTLLYILLTLGLTLTACGPSEPPGFDDHTLPQLESREDYARLAKSGASLEAVKFVVTEFDKSERQAHYYDANFYTLHDEWYWFRLMNNARVAGDDTNPYEGSFATIEDIYTFAKATDELPLDLRFVGERLYSPRFYSLAIGTGSTPIKAGTLIHIDERTIDSQTYDEVWAFELEFSDRPDHEALTKMFEALSNTLPSDIAEQLHWVIRSNNQELLAQEIERDQLLYHDRLLRYEELAVPGETEVYSEGLTAGRLEIVRVGEAIPQDAEGKVLILEEIPDYLPPSVALITTLPQTPLAHINVLAKNRGIPNVYLGGASSDPNLSQLARVNSPVVVFAQAPGELVIKAISREELAQYRALNNSQPIAVPEIDLENAPLSIDLSEVSLNEVDTLRPLIGGKAAGFLALLEPGDITVPDAPLCITAKPYKEHLAPLETRLVELMQNGIFIRDLRARVFALEGDRAYQRRFNSDDDIAFGRVLLERGDVLGDTCRLGGIQSIIEDASIDEENLSQIMQTLRETYGDYDIDQGLRFRSSSTVEDIEGFNGAGLYSSNTGYIDHEARDSNKSVERALKKTWSSYWGSEAFEERELANVSHLSGNMAVLVHARFDDDKEVSNAVFTMTKLPPEFLPLEYELVVNVQKGALSITNPEVGSTATPEVDIVRASFGDLQIERASKSSEVPNDEVVLSDEKLLILFEQARAVTDAALAHDNNERQDYRLRRTLTLDFEMREMQNPWPLLSQGNQSEGARLIIKQARSLEPGVLNVPELVLNQPFPRDVTERARVVARRRCESNTVTLTLIEALTDPLRAPDLGYSDEAFVAFAQIDFKGESLDLGFERGDRFTIVHDAFESLTYESGEAWALSIESEDTRAQTINVSEDSLTIVNNSGTLEENVLTCERDILFSTPEVFLKELLEE